MLFLAVLISLLMGLFAYQLAVERKQDPWLWIILAMLFGVLALLVLYFLKPKKILEKPIKEEFSLSEKLFFSNPSHHNQLWWAVDDQGNVLNAMSFKRLAGLVKEKKVKHSSYVWNETFSEWKMLSDLINKSTN